MRSFKFIAILVVAALCSCTNDPIDEGGAANVPTGIDRKIMTSSLESEQGELLVKFSDEAIAAVETGVTRTEATRTGLQRFDAALTDIEAVSLERVFPDIPKHEAQARAFGLHLWYVVKFNPEVSLATAARKLAAADEVAYVQYNNRIVESYDREEPIPYDRVRNADYTVANTDGNVMSSFNDPRLKDQWHYKNTGDESLVKPIKAGSDINLEPAWELCTGDPSIIVAVMDQGVVYNHEDLATNMWINEKELKGSEGVDDDGNGYVDDIYGYNFVKNTGKITWNDPKDNGHGTHVAGTIAAVNNNGIGVCGIAGGSGNNDGVKIMSIQAFVGEATVSVAASARAIQYAADNGASILQCSWGSGPGAFNSDQAYENECRAEVVALKYFIESERPGSPLNGGIAFFAAGNSSMDCEYPASYPTVVCVTSIGTDFTPSTFTCFGLPADITAPGGDNNYHEGGNQAGKVLSTLLPLRGMYGYMAGTSMSTPHVSGVAALGLSYAKQLGKTFEPDEFRDMVLASVNDLDPYLTGVKKHNNGTMNLVEYKGKMGSGMIDAYKMLMAVRGTPAITVEQDKPTTISLSKYYGDVTALSCTLEVSDAVKDKLGLTFTVEGNNATITCSKQSAGLVTVKSSVGGTSMSREVAIICRAKAASNGGWL
ncbi:S8 family serine peptidase [Alistipes putredinis]|uniref:S8 family serine peptidase n=1 Tax=Alistipes putredinis TaxID=28117 RepID=UPI00242D3A6F|nr:S8 family serine peptidase [Alistipes putredinis]MBS6651795.1 S8 family serine peptidase [Alistipes putredinis]